MTPTSTHAPPSLAAIKARQQTVWSSGDYAAVAARFTVLPGEVLAESADIQAGWRVLDVATGTGNAAIAAARRGASVTGADYVPALVEHGRRRAAVEGLDVTFVHGDAEALPFDDGSFDAVLSAFGAMFAPDQERTASELVRVCRPGGTIALASWTPDGFVAETFRTVAAYVAPPPGLESPFRWGSKEGVGTLLDDDVDWIRFAHRTCTFRFGSADEFVSFFRTNYGPTLKAFEALDATEQDALSGALEALAREHGRFDERGAVTIPCDYAEVVAARTTRR